jgi:hypothetical protein
MLVELIQHTTGKQANKQVLSIFIPLVTVNWPFTGKTGLNNYFKFGNQHFLWILRM